MESAEHVYKVYTQVISPTLRGGIFVGDEPEGELEVGAGISSVEEAQASEASATSAYGGYGQGRVLPFRVRVVNISIASIAYSSLAVFTVHEGQAVDNASFTSSVPIVPRAKN